MGYYRGGAGDYYGGRGKGDFLGVLKGIGGIAGGIAKTLGGPIGGIAGTVIGGLLGGGSGGGKPLSIPLPGALGGGSIQPGAFLPGGVPLYSGAGCPPGFHKDKKTGLRCVRNRSMNPANPKALRRGLRRVQGFGALAARAAGDVARANRSLNRLPRKSSGRKKR